MDKSFPIKGNFWLVMLFGLPILLYPVFNFLYCSVDLGLQEHWKDPLFFLFAQCLWIILSLFLIWFHQVNMLSMIKRPAFPDFAPSLKLTLYTLFVSMAAVYILYYPLSLAFPEFVAVWLIESWSIIIVDADGTPFWVNLFIFVSIVILAPVSEELVFRGLLLHGWTEKWGVNRAIVVSSLLFGIMHADLIGATVFGVAMCVIYIKTKTLIVPIVCHAANNLVVWLFEAGAIAIKGKDHVYSLENFQSDWYLGVIAAIAVFLWTLAYLRAKKPAIPLVLPQL